MRGNAPTHGGHVCSTSDVTTRARDLPTSHPTHALLNRSRRDVTVSPTRCDPMPLAVDAPGSVDAESPDM